MELTEEQQDQLMRNIHCGVLTQAEAVFVMMAVSIAMKTGLVERRLSDVGVQQIMSACQPKGTPQRQLCVDGHEYPDPESNWSGDGQYPPFAIFDIDAQENLQPYYATRAQAEEAMKRIQNS